MGADNQKTLRVCAWCNKDLTTAKVVDPEVVRDLCDQDKVTHGVCIPCKDHIMNDFGVTRTEMDTAVEVASS